MKVAALIVGLCVISVAFAREKEMQKSATNPLTVYVRTSDVRHVHNQRWFYSWIGGVDHYQITNSNPKIGVSNYPQHAEDNHLLIDGTVLLPIHTQHTLTGWVKGSRIVRITIDEDQILIEVPPDIPIAITSHR